MEMMAASPFPKATKARLRELEALPSEDRQGRGWSTSPLHVGCRGVLQRTGTVSRLPTDEMTSADPVSGLEVVVPEEAGVGDTPVAVAEDLFGVRATQARIDRLPEDVMGKVEVTRLTFGRFVEVAGG